MRPKTSQEELDDFITQAEREGKWLYSPYQQLWFSPAELRAANVNGRFNWSVGNWRLRDPQELITQAEQAVAAANEHLASVRERVQRAASHPPVVEEGR